MLRSRAPSAQTAKRLRQADEDVDEGKDQQSSMVVGAPCKRTCLDTLESDSDSNRFDSFKWGTKNLSAQDLARAVEGHVKSKLDLKIFNMQWRKVSNKKHKTWAGNGTLEINIKTSRAVIKDHTGKIMGSTMKLKVSDLKEDFGAVIGFTEIELQEEIHNGSVEQQYTDESSSESFNQNEMRNIENQPLNYGEKPKMSALSMSSKKSRETINIKTESSKVQGNSSRSGFRKRHELTNSNDFILQPPSFSSADDDEHIPQWKLRPVTVLPQLAQKLRSHQRVGVSFIYSCLMGFRKPDCFGCILADEMGLGKTLQVLTVAHTLLKKSPIPGEDRVVRRVLIVTPAGLKNTWMNEISKWLGSERLYGHVIHGEKAIQKYTKMEHVPFVIVSYDILPTLIEPLRKLQCDLLICDEAHRLKNQKTKAYIALKELGIKRRIIVTGTPIQNDLRELYALVDLVNPDVLGSVQEFQRDYVTPIEKSRNIAMDEESKSKVLGVLRTHQLNAIMKDFVIHRLQSINKQYLPKKREYICILKPSKFQCFMLKKAVEIYEQCKDSDLQKFTPLQIITILRKISSSPSLIASTRSPSNKLVVRLQRLISNQANTSGSKMEFVKSFLTDAVKGRNEKCVLVSNYTKTLDLLEKLCDNLKLKHLRIDGVTKDTERNHIVETFNQNAADNGDVALVCLLSAKAGGVGLNLIGASRLILFDNDWNPATDAQAMSRIWRDGQQNEVQIYRLVTAGCIDEKIFQRQMMKVNLGSSVLENFCQNNLKITPEELADLSSVQDDFETCLTHESLGCGCAGDGQNTIEKEIVTTNNQSSISELLHWEHYQPPFNDVLLKEAFLTEVRDDIVYLFTQSTENGIPEVSSELI